MNTKLLCLLGTLLALLVQGQTDTNTPVANPPPATNTVAGALSSSSDTVPSSAVIPREIGGSDTNALAIAAMTAAMQTAETVRLLRTILEKLDAPIGTNPASQSPPLEASVPQWDYSQPFVFLVSVEPQYPQAAHAESVPHYANDGRPYRNASYARSYARFGGGWSSGWGPTHGVSRSGALVLRPSRFSSGGGRIPSGIGPNYRATPGGRALAPNNPR